jgi:hypothetical protein
MVRIVARPHSLALFSLLSTLTPGTSSAVSVCMHRLSGFYQIVTRIEVVYDLFLPAAVRELLLHIQLTISLGIEGVPLECVGATGYITRLLLWSSAPLFLVLLAVLIEAVRLCRRRQFGFAKDFRAVIPVTLRIVLCAAM